MRAFGCPPPHLALVAGLLLALLPRNACQGDGAVRWRELTAEASRGFGKRIPVHLTIYLVGTDGNGDVSKIREGAEAAIQGFKLSEYFDLDWRLADAPEGTLGLIHNTMKSQHVKKLGQHVIDRTAITQVLERSIRQSPDSYSIFLLRPNQWANIDPTSVYAYDKPPQDMSNRSLSCAWVSMNRSIVYDLNKACTGKKLWQHPGLDSRIRSALEWALHFILPTPNQSDVLGYSAQLSVELYFYSPGRGTEMEMEKAMVKQLRNALRNIEAPSQRISLHLHRVDPEDPELSVAFYSSLKITMITDPDSGQIRGKYVLDSNQVRRMLTHEQDEDFQYINDQMLKRIPVFVFFVNSEDDLQIDGDSDSRAVGPVIIAIQNTKRGNNSGVVARSITSNILRILAGIPRSPEFSSYLFQLDGEASKIQSDSVYRCYILLSLAHSRDALLNAVSSLREPEVSSSMTAFHAESSRHRRKELSPENDVFSLLRRRSATLDKIFNAVLSHDYKTALSKTYDLKSTTLKLVNSFANEKNGNKIFEAESQRSFNHLNSRWLEWLCGILGVVFGILYAFATSPQRGTSTSKVKIN